MDKIEAELKELGIDLVCLEIDKPGYFLSEKKIFAISDKLSEEKAIEVIYHELGHFKLHPDETKKYKNPSLKSAMENDANVFMINRISEDNDGYLNYSSVIEEYQIALGWENKLIHKF